MLSVASTARVYLYMQAVDIRRSYDGLHAIVQSGFTRDIRLGDYFMFINRRRDRIKIIWWDKDGLAIFMKRLRRTTRLRTTAVCGLLGARAP
jgi:transposase